MKSTNRQVVYLVISIVIALGSLSYGRLVYAETIKWNLNNTGNIGPGYTNLQSVNGGNASATTSSSSSTANSTGTIPIWKQLTNPATGKPYTSFLEYIQTPANGVSWDTAKQTAVSDVLNNELNSPNPPAGGGEKAATKDELLGILKDLPVSEQNAWLLLALSFGLSVPALQRMLAKLGTTALVNPNEAKVLANPNATKLMSLIESNGGYASLGMTKDDYLNLVLFGSSNFKDFIDPTSAATAATLKGLEKYLASASRTAADKQAIFLKFITGSLTYSADLQSMANLTLSPATKNMFESYESAVNSAVTQRNNLTSAQVVASLKQPLLNQLTDAKILAHSAASSSSTSTAAATQAEILKAAGQIAQASISNATATSVSLSLTGNKRLLYEYVQANNTRLNLNLNLDDVAAVLTSSLETAIPDLMSLPNLTDKTIFSNFLLNGFTRSSILGMLSTSQVPTKGISFYNVDGYARQQMNSTVEQLYASALAVAKFQNQVSSYVSPISATATPVLPITVTDYNSQVAWYDQQISQKQQEAQTLTLKAQALNVEIANLSSQVSTTQIDLKKLIAYNSSSNAFLSGPAIPSNVQVFYKTSSSSTIYGMFADGSIKAYPDKNQFMNDGGKSDFSNVQVLTQAQITQKQNDYIAQFKALGAIADQKIAAEKAKNQTEINRLNALITSIDLTIEQRRKDLEAAEAAKVKALQDGVVLQNKKLSLVKPTQSTSVSTVSFSALNTASGGTLSLGNTTPNTSLSSVGNGTTVGNPQKLDTYVDLAVGKLKKGFEYMGQSGDQITAILQSNQSDVENLTKATTNYYNGLGKLDNFLPNT